ncbi:HTH-type transcriptional regulator [Octadecabacter antarcticus 307]|uniref:HTH-type transcriptional regulator n=1 Tax=Octadecabacter antarcticus 307 TaxID=391626 RepID=M9RCY1_9RHOB|nr:Cu(I)-responsive transcriptional regulator [Octadecabacter antarcticus]AGI69618.1 HTH-type transcriptional regulator [Octadecabacter antarcticus 307]
MNIGEIATRSGLPAKTIRYYEDINLIKPLRDTNGYRAFRQQDLHKLTFLGRARALGFSIEDCRNLLALYEDQNRSSADVKSIARDHLAKIEQKIADLIEMQQTLNHLIGACAGDNRPDCPILNSLDVQSL